MKVLGLTGGIGSGKSTIALIFSVLGIRVYNSDEQAKKIYFNPEIRTEVEKLLGKDAYLTGTGLDKKYISRKIFGDSNVLEKLNAIIHPAVIKDFETFKQLFQNEKYIVKESALLLEAGLLKTVDKLVVVTSSPELRKIRIQKRDQLTKDEMEKIMASQLPDKEKIKSADWVLKNDEETLLIPQVLKIHKELLELN